MRRKVSCLDNDLICQFIQSGQHFSKKKPCLVEKRKEEKISQSREFKELERELERLKRRYVEERNYLMKEIKYMKEKKERMHKEILKIKIKNSNVKEHLSLLIHKLINLQEYNYELYWQIYNQRYLQQQLSTHQHSNGYSHSQIQTILNQSKSHEICFDNCCICFEQIRGKRACQFECSHYYHRQCISEWLKLNKNCPLCRKKISKH